MADPTEDFWPPDFRTITDDPAPVSLLRQQAQILSGKTNGRVQGVVRDETVGGTVYYSLYLKAPALGDYMFKFLHLAIPVSRSTADPFPLTAADTFDNGDKEVQGMEGFKTWLKAVLSSEGVKTVVSNLIRRSESLVSS